MTPPLDPASLHTPAASSLQAALFIDLAGVLLDATAAPGRLPGLRGGVGAALRLLDRLDYRIVVLAPCALDRRQATQAMPARIADLLARERVGVVACLGCAAASTPCTGCPPAAALLLRAASEHDLALPASWLLAGHVQHLAAGRLAGCRTVLVGGGENAWPVQSPWCGAADGPAAYQARDIVDAALAIVRLAENR